MMDTIKEKTHVCLFSEPERYDIITLLYPDNGKEAYIKRIIGLPGETVNIIGGEVYINDSVEPLDDSFAKKLGYDNLGPLYIPENCYFVLGDNRGNSLDSRWWGNKYVESEKILGRVITDR